MEDHAPNDAADTPPEQADEPRAAGADGGEAAPAEPFSSRRAVDDDDEQTLWDGGFSPRAMYGTWVLLGLVTALLLVGVLVLFGGASWAWIVLAVVAGGLWAYFAGVLLYRRLGIRYHLTTQRFVHELGVLKRVTDRIEVIDMDDISFEQSLVDRVFGVGNLKITSSDRTHPEMFLRGIENVRDVAETMDNARRKERIRRGVHIESV